MNRPLVRWHGGKWRLAPWIISFLPAHKVYTEAFGGGGSVLLRKPRSYAEVYNDLDGEIVNLFRVCRDNGPELVRVLELTPFSREDFEQSYTATEDCLEQARRTVVRSFMGFSSSSHAKATGFRSNSNRSGSTPAQDWWRYPDSLVSIVQRLRGVVIENRDALEIINHHDSEDACHYVDPPYMPETRDKGVDYRHEMNAEEHESLLSSLIALSGSVVLSGYDSDVYNDLLADWHKVSVRALADGARERTECLWIKGDLPQPCLFGGDAG